MTSAERQTNHAHKFLATITTPGDIIEIRALNDEGSASFLFTDMRIAARIAMKLNSDYTANVYYTVNPISPESRTARSHHPLNVPRLKGTRSASDSEIQRVAWYPIDIDPVRESGTASTDAQLAEAHATMERLRTDRANEGWPEPIIICSGNGYHLLYKAEGSTENSIDWKGALRALAARFDTPTIKIDPTVCNPSRILRLPGFYNRKGEATEERPHRLARAISYPDVITVLDIGKVRELAWFNAPRPAVHSDRESELAIDEEGLREIIESYPEVLTIWKETVKGDQTWFGLDECPFAGRQHTGQYAGAGKSAVVIDTVKGYVGFSCFSPDCVDNTFYKLRKLLEERTGRPTPQIYEDEEFDFEALLEKWNCGGDDDREEDEYWEHADEIKASFDAIANPDPAWGVPTRESIAREIKLARERRDAYIREAARRPPRPRQASVEAAPRHLTAAELTVRLGLRKGVPHAHHTAR
jgi:hypothetical protein